jgi:hypothetical protein
MVKKRRRPKKKQAKKEPATVHHKHKAHPSHQVQHTPQVHHANPIHHEHHSSQEHVGNSTERILVQNFVSLQKVMVTLSDKLIILNNQTSKLLDLFEVSARTLARKDFDLGKREKEDTKKIIDKLENLSEQNKIIAKGLTLIHENRQGESEIEEPMTFEQEEQEPIMEDLPAPPKPWQMPPAPFMQKTQNQNQMQFKLPPLEKMPTPIKTTPVNPTNPMNQNNFPRKNINPPSPGFFKARRQEIEQVEPVERSEPAVPEMESAEPSLPELPEEMPEIGDTENESNDFEESMSSDSSPFEGK